jgi:hypothetical protein
LYRRLRRDDTQLQRVVANEYAKDVQAIKRTRTRLMQLVAGGPEDAADAADAAASEDSDEAYKGDDARRRAAASSGGTAVAGSHEARTGKHAEDCAGSTRGVLPLMRAWAAC